MEDYQIETVICIVGLGYVGFPLAEAFAKHFPVIGFDRDINKLNTLKKQGFKESEDSLSGKGLFVTSDPNQMQKADYIILCVPTPLSKSKDPDLSYVINASKTVGSIMKKNSTIILESTVYPGVTEEIVVPILEKESSLKCGIDFKIAYSPERINPGDDVHTINKITKVVAGMDKATTDRVAEVYQVITGNIFKATDIRTAEAAKVIENVQRDLNIALINELSIIFDRMDIRIWDVLDAAETKWNFHRYDPGLVGGHCIPVDPYYLVYKAKQLGYNPQVILAGRQTNDFMPKHVASMAMDALKKAGKDLNKANVLIMGLTYKQNLPDIRETPAKVIIEELNKYKVQLFGFDPMLESKESIKEFNIQVLEDLKEAKTRKFDCIIVTVAHAVFNQISLQDIKEMQNTNPILIDVRKMYDHEKAHQLDIDYRSL